MKKTTITKKNTATTTTSDNKKNAYLSQVITADNVQMLGEHTAKKALKTIYNRSQDDFIRRLINDFNRDMYNAKNNIAENFSNAYDIAQTAICFYCEYLGQPLNATANNGEVDKEKKPIDIYRACLRKINRYILENKNKVYKTVYLQDIDENGEHLEYIAIPQKWDMPTITDYQGVINAIEQMKLSATEKKILYARLRGFGYDTIAKKLSIAKGTVQTYIKRIQAKATAINLTPQAIRQLKQLTA